MATPVRKRLRSTSPGIQDVSKIRSQVDRIVGRTQALLLNRAANELHDAVSAETATLILDTSEKFFEQDGIRPSGSELSVGTKIKRECIMKYPRYEILEDQDKSLVALGANSILDLSKPNSVHKELFSHQQWAHLLHQFRSTCESNTTLLEENNSILRGIEKLARKDLNAARLKANKLENAHKGALSTLLNMYSEYLKILQFRKRLLRPDLEMTDDDLAVKLWGPLLECIMRDEEDLRLKWEGPAGHSAPEVDDQGRTGMKARVVRDEFPALNNKKESHMGNVTISHMNEPVGKTTIDKAYLFIESKCVIDRTIIDSNPDRPVVVPAMQIIGSHAKLFSVRLAAPGLYVVVSEGSCTLPTTVDTFRDLREVYILLRKFKDASVDLSNALIYSNRADDLKKEHLRDTWMPPRSGVRISPLPKYLLQSIGESSD